MVDIELAKYSDTLLRGDRAGYVNLQSIGTGEYFDRVTGRVIYVGCGEDMSSIFQFERAESYIHQDRNDFNAPKILSILARERIISNLRIGQRNDIRRESTFVYKSQAKVFVEYSNPRDRVSQWGTRTDIGLFIPEEARYGFEAIDLVGIPFIDVIKIMLINLLPYLKVGGVLHGDTREIVGNREDAGRLGLNFSDMLLIKRNHLRKQMIEQALVYTSDDYRRFLDRWKTVQSISE